MLSYDIPSQSRSKLSVDLFQLDGNHYLVTVDHYSDYFELDSLRSATASVVIQAIKRIFARHGIPDECICDNGPQFDSYEYSRFARDYGCNLVKSSPYYIFCCSLAEKIHSFVPIFVSIRWIYFHEHHNKLH